MRIFQFTSMQRPEAAARLIRATRRTPSTVVLDLEDSLWDVTDESNSPSLKAAGRTDLVALARTHPELFAAQAIGVRINRLSGPDAEPDLEALGRASRFVEFECVVPTKVETGAEIHEIVEGLRAAGVLYRSIVPIVETRRGVANLSDVIDGARGAGVEWLVYGHFDLALDSGWWPFPEPNDADYWEPIETIIRGCESAGIRYVQPPYFHTRDQTGLAAIQARLSRTCTHDFGMITVGPRQTEMAGRLSGEVIQSDDSSEAAAAGRWPGRSSDETPSDLARHVVQTFDAVHGHSGGFALDPRTGEFISPHLYVAARAYLNRLGDG